MDLPWGMFGENLTTAGVTETDLHIGDRVKIGSAILMIRQPRMPCYKLAAKFQRDDLIERFLASGRSGFYFYVEREGDVGAGDSMEFISQNQAGITIAQMNHLLAHDRYNRDLLRRAIATEELPVSWSEYFQRVLNGSANHT